MTPSAPQDPTASANITQRIRDLGGWRGETLARMRALIHAADPAVVETWKWMGTPIWEHDGILCTGEAYKSVVKLTFAKGAALADPMRLFNSSLEGSTRRALDIREGETVDADAFKALIRAAVAHNQAAKAAKATPAGTHPAKPRTARPRTADSRAAKPRAAKPRAAKPRAARSGAAKPRTTRSAAKKK